jgi:hypothetical protein
MIYLTTYTFLKKALLTKNVLFLDMLKLSKDIFFQRKSFCEEK